MYRSLNEEYLTILTNRTLNKGLSGQIQRRVSEINLLVQKMLLRFETRFGGSVNHRTITSHFLSLHLIGNGQPSVGQGSEELTYGEHVLIAVLFVVHR